MKLVHLHAPDGHDVGVNPDQVVSVRPAENGAYDARAKTVIVESNGFQAVREPEAEVEKKLTE